MQKQTPKKTIQSNVVEQSPFLGFMLDELIHAQAMAFIPVVELLEDVRKEVAQVKQEIRDRRDEGEYKYVADTATTADTVYDFTRDFGHSIKSFLIANDGANTIQIGWMSLIGLPTDIAAERMSSVLAGETFPISNNVRCIKTMKFKTTSGLSAYRLWLLW